MRPFVLALVVLFAGLSAAPSAQENKPPGSEAKPAPAAHTLRPGVASKLGTPAARVAQPPGDFKRQLGVRGGMDYEQLRKLRLQAERDAEAALRPPAVVPQNRRDYRRQPADCDDRDRSVHPNQVEVCNFKDDNCDGQVDEGVTWTLWRDQDGDGFGDPRYPVATCPVGQALSNLSLNDRDCDDTDPARNPSLGTCP